MAAPEQKSPQETVSELLTLTKTYAMQETVEPVKGLGKFVGFGLGAALLGSIGIIVLLLSVLRVLQTETGGHLTGSLTWVPYLVTLVIAVVLIGLALLGITRKKERGA